ncbi:hypothetical protein PybrP1_000085 [[Pythium] brassicae (nom. inval.)]|nr:hypothetical protein PybrP1_000085 [[Pythium] brassicae (nom. inval.)]
MELTPAERRGHASASPPSAPTRVETFPSRFESWEALEAYITELGASTYQVFHRRSSTSVAQRHAAVAESRRRRGLPPTTDVALLPPAHWLMYQRVFACTCGFKSTRRGQGLRTHVAVRGTGCAAKITATVRFDRMSGAHYLHAQLRGAHNHPCDRERYYSYAENRRFEPALLREMAALHTRGAKAREVLEFAARYVRNKTGMESFYRITDVRNALRRFQRLEQGADESGGGAVRDDDDDDDDDADGNASTRAGDESDRMESDDSPQESDDERECVNREAGDGGSTGSDGDRRKRKADAISSGGGGSGDGLALPARQQRVTLSEIEVIVNAPYSYALACGDIEATEIAVLQQLPQTISGFACEVVLLSPRFQAADADFVLPRFAIAGCEDAIAEASRARALPPSGLGVKVTVEMPTSGERRTALLTSRQVATMKRFHAVRQHVVDATKSLAWIDTARYPSRRPAAPFDDLFDRPKTFVRSSLRSVPLTRTVVRGRVSDPVASLAFTDTVHGASLLRFASGASLDLECVKAVLLHLHSRFYEEAGVICPAAFVLEPGADALARTRKANTYGAFKGKKQCVLGALQLQSQGWGAFFYDCARSKCFLFQAADSDFSEHRERVHELLRGFNVDDVAFACSSSPAAGGAVSVSDSGVFALLFLELFVHKVSWEQIPCEAVEYFRLRYLLQSIRVVNNQDVHEIASL